MHKIIFLSVCISACAHTNLEAQIQQETTRLHNLRSQRIQAEEELKALKAQGSIR